MKNLKIGRKLLLTFGIIIVMFCGVVCISLLSLRGNDDKFDDFYTAGYEITNKVMDVRRAIQSSAKNIGYCMMSESNEDTQGYIQSCKEDSVTMQNGLDFMKSHYRGDISLVDGFEQSMNSIKDAREQVYALALDNKNTEASQLYFEKVRPGYTQANEYLTKIYDDASAEAVDNYTRATSSIRIAIYLLLGISVVVLVITIGLSGYMTLSLTRPIKEIEAAASGMADGVLDVEVSYESKDELGVLADRIRHLGITMKSIIEDEDYLLREMAGGNFDLKSRIREAYVGDFHSILLSIRQINTGISDALGQINQAADQVAIGSEQVSSGSQELSQGATEQASAVEELAASISQISGQIEENAQSAVDASSKAELVGEEVVESNERMKNMLSAMEDITHASNEISKIIKTIEDIAFQTNILALNAAVEAARAGSAGKGFAVVADEVRSLASKSAEASKSTSALIESALRAVEHGTRIADDTAQSLGTVVTGAKAVTDILEHIAAASREQAEAIGQVTKGINQISSVVQTNSATAEESAAASEELNGQSQMLKGIVGKFRLKKADNY